VPIANITELKSRMGPLMGSAWTSLSSDAQDQAAQQAMDELGWDFEVTHPKRAYWTIERTKRHALYVTVIVQAERFKYKQISLQQKFDNYFKLIANMDVLFAKAVENDIDGVFPVEMVDGESFAVNGFMMNPAGFIYDQLGRDLTYAEY